jgi:uncharacterized protein
MRALLIALLLSLLPTLAPAQTYPHPSDDTLIDAANLLSPADEAALAERLRAARRATGVHVMLVTFSSRRSLGFESTALEPFATGLFNKWGIGDAKRNDGVLILVMRDDREMRVELGTGFGSAYDRAAQRVIDKEFLPAFRKGDYSGGIQTGTEAVITHIVQGFAKGTPGSQVYPSPLGGLTALVWAGIGAIGLLLGFIASKSLWMFKRCPNCGKRGMERSVVTLQNATEAQSGQEKVTTICPSCQHKEVYLRVVPRINRDRGGRSGGGGFGGGRSSGGGASGRW